MDDTVFNYLTLFAMIVVWLVTKRYAYKRMAKRGTETYTHPKLLAEEIIKNKADESDTKEERLITLFAYNFNRLKIEIVNA